MIGEAVDRDPRAADAGADERRHAPPGAEIDIGVGENDPLVLGGMIGVGADAARIGDAVGAVELRIAAIFTGDVTAEPVVELVADAEAEDARGVEAVMLHRRGQGCVERVVQPVDALIAESDIAAQIPAAEIFDHRGGAYIGGGGAIAMSAANAAEEIRVAVPAAMRDFTLRIGFVLLSGEADRTASLQKLTAGTMAPNA